jgi:hypothetical protein
MRFDGSDPERVEIPRFRAQEWLLSNQSCAKTVLRYDNTVDATGPADR